ncbi:hypothetical protein V500_07547 [Pseudogymnoascus sp. VKM F-4518 (FW-2643)]|nr:hypothetical protein V500_07547 [Pseudogymnoascus sp. VKM F-4518 (FW-2643)]
MPSFTTTFGPLTSTTHGLVVSSLLLTTTLASLFGGAISDHLGRPPTIVIGALLFCLGAAIEASAMTLGMFISGRCIAGLGQGTNFSTLVVYICEISPPSKRGPLASSVQLLICLGVMMGRYCRLRRRGIGDVPPAQPEVVGASRTQIGGERDVGSAGCIGCGAGEGVIRAPLSSRHRDERTRRLARYAHRSARYRVPRAPAAEWGEDEVGVWGGGAATDGVGGIHDGDAAAEWDRRGALLRPPSLSAGGDFVGGGVVPCVGGVGDSYLRVDYSCDLVI